MAVQAAPPPCPDLVVTRAIVTSDKGAMYQVPHIPAAATTAWPCLHTCVCICVYVYSRTGVRQLIRGRLLLVVVVQVVEVGMLEENNQGRRTYTRGITVRFMHERKAG